MTLSHPVSRFGPRWRQPAVIALGLTVALLLLGQVMRPGFASYGQAMNLLRLASFLGFVAAGQTLVILAGGEGIDLSVGAVVTLSAALIYKLVNGVNGMVLPAFLVASAVGLLVGTINGVGVSYLRIPALVMTLGMTGAINGLVLVLTGGRFEGAAAPAMKQLVTDPWLAGVPGVVFLWVGLGLLMGVLLRCTRYSKELYATGANRTAARFAGVPTGRVIVFTYALSGLLAAVGGFVLLGYTSSVFLTLGDQYTLPSIAAVVVGGTLISGGAGGYAGTISGALLLTVLQSLLITLGLPEFGRQIIYGLILLVLLSLYGRGRSLRT